MLIYEKNNKLNINFDNEVSEQPDLQISKEDGKTSVTIDGQQNSQIPVPVLPDDVGKIIVVNAQGQYQLADISSVLPVEIVPWATGTDAQIAKMIAALDSGKITVADTGWQIGDEREVSLAAMEATGVGESHNAQTVTFVLMDSGHFDLTTPTAGGSTKDHFVVGMKDCLDEMGYMNATNTNEGSWPACARRAWCNSIFRNAIPQTLRNCFKQFQVITAETVSGTTNLTSDDYFALPAVKEVFGAVENSNATEAAALSQIAYYETAANRIKQVDGSAVFWWERSPVAGKGEAGYFGVVGNDGVAGNGGAGGTRGLAPFGCI